MKKIMILILTGLLIVPNLYALNQTHLINVTLYPPAEYNFNYTFNTINNDSYYHYVDCISNYTSGKCDITRSLNSGETYVREDNYCDLQFTCPDQEECEEVSENVTHEFQYRMYYEDNHIHIITDGVNKTYPYGESFDFTDEIDFQCPDCDDECDSEYEEYINVSEDVWYFMCGRNVNQIIKTYADSVASYTEYEKVLKDDRDVCLDSNKELASANAQLKEQVTQLDKCRGEVEALQNKLDECNENSVDCRGYKAESGTWLFYIITEAIVILVLITMLVIPRITKTILGEGFE